MKNLIQKQILPNAKFKNSSNNKKRRTHGKQKQKPKRIR